jgi:hypothetical protein
MIHEGSEEIIFAAQAGTESMLVKSAPLLRQSLKSDYASTPDRYRIKIRTVNGDTICI